MERPPRPNRILADLKILVVIVNGYGIGRVGLQLDRVGAKLLGRTDQTNCVIIAMIMIGRDLGDDICRLSRANQSTTNFNCPLHSSFPHRSIRQGRVSMLRSKLDQYCS